VAVLAVPDELAGYRRIAARGAAQLADEPVLAVGWGGWASIKVDLLAGERRAAAVRTAIAVGLQRAEATT